MPNHGQFLDSFIVSTHIDKQEFVSNIFTYIYIYIYIHENLFKDVCIELYIIQIILNHLQGFFLECKHG